MPEILKLHILEQSNESQEPCWNEFTALVHQASQGRFQDLLGNVPLVSMKHPPNKHT